MPMERKNLLQTPPLDMGFKAQSMTFLHYILFHKSTTPHA